MEKILVEGQLKNQSINILNIVAVFGDLWTTVEWNRDLTMKKFRKIFLDKKHEKKHN